jgi:type I restriction enzyme S subunit
VSIVCNEKINNIFLLYWVRHKKAYITRFAAGTTFDEIGRRTFGNLKVRHPKETSEQKAIGHAIAAIDSAIGLTESSIAKAERLQKGFMQQLLTGRLKPDGAPRSQSEFWEDRKLGLVPKGWIVEKGLKLADKITKGQSPKWQGFDYATSGMLFVTSENVRDGFLDVTAPKFLPLEFNEKIKGSELQSNDILINLVGASIGRSCIFESEYKPANVNQAVCVFRPKPSIVSRYVGYYLRLASTRNRLLSSRVETARSNLSLGDVRRLRFALPEDEGEQNEIAERLHRFTELIDAKKQKVETLKRVRASLMQNLLSGRFRIPVETEKIEAAA